MDRCLNDICNVLPGKSGVVCDSFAQTVNLCTSGVVADHVACSGCVSVPGGGDYCPGLFNLCDNISGTGNFCVSHSIAMCNAGHTQWQRGCAPGCISTGLGVDACMTKCPMASGTMCVANGYGVCTQLRAPPSSSQGCPNGCIQDSSTAAHCRDVPNECANLPNGTGFICATAYGVEGGALQQCANGAMVNQVVCGSGLCVSMGNGLDYCPGTSVDCQGLPNGTNCVSGSTIAWCSSGNKQGEKACTYGCVASVPGSDVCAVPLPDLGGASTDGAITDGAITDAASTDGAVTDFAITDFATGGGTSGGGTPDLATSPGG
jgi:hypothetical protein